MRKLLSRVINKEKEEQDEVYVRVRMNGHNSLEEPLTFPIITS